MDKDIKNNILIYGTDVIKKILSQIDQYEPKHVFEILRLLHAAQSRFFYPVARIFSKMVLAADSCPEFIYYSHLSPENLALLLEQEAKNTYNTTDSTISCNVSTFSERYVLKGHAAFYITCPTCSQENIINFSSSYVHDNIFLCPTCFQKLKINEKKIIGAVKNGILEIGKLYSKTNKVDILFRIISAAILLKKFVDIYFIQLRSERIGHYIGNTFGFLATLNAKGNLDRSLVFAFDNNTPCNYRLKSFLKNYVAMPRWVKDIFFLCRQSPQLQHMAIDVAANNQYILDYGQLHAQKPLRVEFTHSEEELAINELYRLGVDYGKPFICFMGRDSKYIKESGLSNPEIHKCRNMDIRTFLPTMQWFASQGIYCLRIGHTVDQGITENNPYIIDCSMHTVNRILDFYIPGNCAMNISVLSGPIEMSYLRKIPTLIVNQFAYMSLTGSYLPYVYILFKKYYSLREERYLSFEYILKNKLNEQYTDDLFLEKGLKVEDNTPEEILEAAKETWSRIKGEFPSTPEKARLDAQAQSRYRAVAAKYVYNAHHTDIKSFIPLSFLQKNPYFLQPEE